MDQDKSHFPFLRLAAELRNMVYEEALLKKGSIRSLRPPALLCTNRQIRDEALPMYYYNNHFSLLYSVSGDSLGAVPICFNGIQSTIKKHIQHMTLFINHEISDLSPYNNHLRFLFRCLPEHFFVPGDGLGKPEAQWTDYSLAKEQFFARLKEEVMVPGSIMHEISENDYNHKLLPVVLELFEAVWRLVYTFPEAKQGIYSFSYLPRRNLKIIFW